MLNSLTFSKTSKLHLLCVEEGPQVKLSFVMHSFSKRLSPLESVGKVTRLYLMLNGVKI